MDLAIRSLWLGYQLFKTKGWAISIPFKALPWPEKSAQFLLGNASVYCVIWWPLMMTIWTGDRLYFVGLFFPSPPPPHSKRKPLEACCAHCKLGLWRTYSWFPKMLLQVGHPYNAIALSIWCNNPPKPLVRSYTIMNLHFQCSGFSCQFESQLEFWVMREIHLPWTVTATTQREYLAHNL